ncbi:MAG: ABC transporter ATP-binding protein [Halofilum sp. (in: g-proteobacteria)]|nr:ABC transporter ATP-binding protein [Halofilum sp. (in: g-proteobacteria)]
MSLLATEGLAIEIGGKRIAGDLDLAVTPKQSWAVLGANGAGKTTLLHTLAGLRPPAGGRVLLDGLPLHGIGRRDIARRLGILLQDSEDPFPSTVFETALIGRHPHIGTWQWESPEDHRRARDALAQVGLESMAERPVDTLSGGERRRLALATLLAQDPAVHLLDEPSNHLDLHHQIHLLGHLRERVTGAGGALVMALHDVNLATRFCDHVLLIFGDGQVRHGPTDELLRPGHLSCLYHHPVQEITADGRRFFVPG